MGAVITKKITIHWIEGKLDPIPKWGGRGMENELLMGTVSLSHV